ncbi:NAD(P)-binding protein [Streptomyces oryzae]|uniref:NAD(P)-binding protein n=1 Tax=Streptomyces oryzae TaxID=1434886 RepID=A0ABS3X8Z9_9ACTN|nr:NAD(P)-binding protein [Streptomyces oryzae]MBO8191838.1 NAD(P)-binding protein [Streptomyces oryzae]
MTLDEHVADGHGHAVVIGASLAGLTAARALANFMDRVTVVERDWVPRGAGRRRGVPQARHTHGLTTAAQHGLELLFPGILGELADAGAVVVRMTEDVLLLGPAGWLPRAESNLSSLSASRDLMDALIRDRLRADPKVTFLQQHDAVLLEPGQQDTVTGVWVRGRDRRVPGGWGERRLLVADFVVDATGRASRAPQWLAELGYVPPRDTTVESRTAFATAVFAPPVGHVADWKSLLLTPAPGHPACGMLNPVEGGRWSVSVCSGDGSRPPTDHTGLLRAAGALRDPLLHDVLQAATPLGPVYSCGPSGNRWRHYEKLRRWPDQFLVVGDAVVALDPAHGQGMTVAVHCALVLDQLLAAHGTAVGLGYRVRRAIAHRLSPVWEASTRALRAAHGEQDPRAGGWRARLGRRYAARIAAAAATERAAANLLLQQLQNAAAPSAALRPAVVRAALRGPRAPVAAGPPSSTHGPNTARIARRQTGRPDTPPLREHPHGQPAVGTGVALHRPSSSPTIR